MSDEVDTPPEAAPKETSASKRKRSKRSGKSPSDRPIKRPVEESTGLVAPRRILITDPGRITGILNDITGGVADYLAAQRHGVAGRTWREWTHRGKEAREKVQEGEDIPESEWVYCDLYDRYTEAVGFMGSAMVAELLEHKVHDPRVLQFMITHHPQLRDIYVAPQKLEHSGPDGKPIEIKGPVIMVPPEIEE